MNDLERVLAENKQLKAWCEEFSALDISKENRKLKEELKEAQEMFDVISTHSCIPDEDMKEQLKDVSRWANEASVRITSLEITGVNK